MDLRRKIFLRLVLLIFLLIAAIGTVTLVLEQDTPPHDTVFAVIVITAFGGGAFLLGILLARAIVRMTTPEVDQLTKTLHESEARFKGIFDNMSSGVAVYQAIDNGNDFVFLDFNHAAERIDKIAREDLIGRPVTEVFPKIENVGLLDVFRRVWRTGEPEYYLVSAYKDERIEGWWENYIYRLPAGEIVAIYDDVTESKQAAQMIEEWRTRYQAAIDASGQILYDWDSSTGEAVYAGRLDAILGYTQEEMAGGLKRWKDLIHTDDLPGFNAIMKQGLETGGSMHGIYRVQKESGEYADIEDTGKFIMDSQGNLFRRLGFLKDITELKQAEIKLSQSEEKFSALVENMSDFVFLIDPELRIIMLNQTASKLIGDKTENIIGKQVSDIFPPHISEMYEEGLRNVFEKSTPLGTDSILQINNSNLFLNTRLNPILDDRGKVRAVIGVSRDITERKQSEEALRASEERYRAVAEDTPVLICRFLPGSEITYTNDAYCKYFEKKPEELVGSSFLALIPEEDRETVVKNILALTVESPTQSHEHRVITSSDEIRWQRWTNRALFDAKGKPIAYQSIGDDITDRKRAEEAIKQRARYLVRLNDAAQTLLIPRSLVPFQEFVDRIGPASDASRAYVFINYRRSDGELIAGRKAEWCTEGIKSKIDNPLPRDLSYNEDLPRWGEILSRGNEINSLVADFPEREREIFEPYGIRSVLIIPIMLENEFIGFIGFNNCISDRKWNEIEETFLRAAANDLAQAIRRAQSEEKVLASLKEKEVLLREIHHRVKNNMQVIVSLLRMHSRRANDQLVEQVFNDCRDRVYAMSLIHEALYQSDDLARIDLEAYLNKLCRNLNQVYGASSKGIILKVNPCSLVLDIDQSITVGMVISELITNSIKHAFPEGKGGTVSISLTGFDKDNVELIVEDNGKGLPLEINILNPPSLGLQLVVSAITREWGGSIEVERDGGTRFVIRFKCKSTN